MGESVVSKCKITVLKKEFYPELAAEYCQDPNVGPCKLFEVGQEMIVDTSAYFKMQVPGGFCAEAWACISHYIYAALQGGALMKGWTKDERVLITCCNDGVRPVIFKLERIDD